MKRRLLVVDDSMFIRALIKGQAMQYGWEVVGEAANGQEAIERYRELAPDAVTLDIVMPEYDGLYALRGIHELDPNAKVLIVSAIEQVEVLKETIRHGAADFIVKPFENKRLKNALELLVPQVEPLNVIANLPTPSPTLPQPCSP